MIKAKELQKLSRASGIRAELLEKDYVMNLILDAIAHCKLSRDKMFIKGGAAIYKCYHYDNNWLPPQKSLNIPPVLSRIRFTNDLDLTVSPDMMDEKCLCEVFNEIGDYLEKRHGLVINQCSFPIYENKKQKINNHFKKNCRGFLHFEGPMFNSKFNAPILKLDLTADEHIVFAPYFRTIAHPYCQAGEEELLIAPTYTLRDIFAEKIRSLFERTSSRDLYDCLYLMHHPDMDALRKTGIGIAILDKFRIKNKPCSISWSAFMNKTNNEGFPIDVQNEYQQQWENCLSRLMINLPPFEICWNQAKDLIQFAGECITLAKDSLSDLKKKNPGMEIHSLIDQQLQKQRVETNKDYQSLIKQMINFRSSERVL